MKRFLRATFLLLLLAAPLFGGQAADLGRVDFANSGAPEAQDAFVRGILLLHSFEYEDAREAFQEARTLDPAFAMAAWGEAMTHNHPLWREQDRDAALAALASYAPTPGERRSRAPTEREAGYLAALDVLYGEGSKLERDLAYSEAMRKLAQQYPDDLEAASFHALSILGTAQGERDFRIYMRAGAVVEEVFDRNPEHPGAIHYLIHSYDDPIHAPLGLRAARVYARIAPAASHAQHMISHIYVALGAWDEVASSNEKSFAVSEERSRRKGLPVWRRNHHALHWLEYAYLQQGRIEAARKQMEIAESDARAGGQENTRWYYAQMRAAFVVNSAASWPADDSIDVSDVGVGALAADHYADGLLALRAGDQGAARKVLQAFGAALEEANRKRETEDAYTFDSPASYVSAEILRLELGALIRAAAGKKEDAVEILERAVALEEAQPHEFGPPIVVKPSHELLGELLLEMGRSREARARFEGALERAPRRTHSLLGLARAAGEMGDAERSREVYAELARIWHSADRDLPELQEVRTALAAPPASARPQAGTP